MRLSQALAAFLAAAAIGYPAVALFAREESFLLPIRLPLGVADLARDTGYVPNTSGGMDAVDLATGKQIWSAAEVFAPLLVAGDRVFGLVAGEAKNRFRVVALDRSTGKTVLRSDAVALPEWASVTPAPGYSLTLTPAVDRDRLLLAWDAKSWYAGGASAPPDIIAKARREASGLASINLTDGKVESSSDAAAIERVRPVIPQSLRAFESAAYSAAGESRTDPFLVGSRVMGFEHSDKTRPSSLTLRRWDLRTGKAAEPLELAAGNPAAVQISADRRHALVLTDAGADRWEAFDLDSGKPVGTVTLPSGAVNPVLLPSTVLYLRAEAPRSPKPGTSAPRFIVATDRKSGQKLWEYQVAPSRVQPLPR